MASRLAHFDCFETFDLGQSFELAAVILSDHVIRNQGSIVPAIAVNSAFSTELFLKCLYNLSTGLAPFKTHNLKFLFSKLLSEHQVEIQEHWDTYELPLCRRARDIYPNRIEVPQSFERALELGSEVFQHWRYGRPANSSWWLRGLGMKARELLLKFRQDWRPVPPSPFLRLELFTGSPEDVSFGRL